jgi:glycerol kinase
VRYVLALDHGTTSSRAIVFDEEGNIVRVAQREFRQIYPKPGWIEHDPKEILATNVMSRAKWWLARVSSSRT